MSQAEKGRVLRVSPELWPGRKDKVLADPVVEGMDAGVKAGKGRKTEGEGAPDGRG